MHWAYAEKQTNYIFIDKPPGLKFPSLEKLYISYVVHDRNSPKFNNNSQRTDTNLWENFVQLTFVLYPSKDDKPIENSWEGTEIRMIALKSIIWSTFKNVVNHI